MKVFTPILFLIIAGIIFFQLTDPVLGQIDKWQEKKTALEEGLKSAQDLIERQNALIAERNEISDEQFERLDKLIPEQVDNVRLIIEMGRIGSRNGMPMRNVTVTTGTKDGEEPALVLPEGDVKNQLNEVDISFTVSGSYPLFKSFMKNLADNLRILDINSFSVKAGEGSLYDYNVGLTTYWLKR
ncbi:MAG: type 4a pilus biogenesis protein PilO [Patescibacteria group bacterium]